MSQFCLLPISSSRKNSPLVTDAETGSEILYPTPFLVNAIIVPNKAFLRIRCPLGNLTVNSQETERSVGILMCEKNNLMLLDYTDELYEFESFGCTRIPELKMKKTSSNQATASIQISVTEFFNFMSFDLHDSQHDWCPCVYRRTTVSTIFRHYLTPIPRNSSKFTRGPFYKDIDPDYLSNVFSSDYQREKFFRDSSNPGGGRGHLYVPQNSGNFEDLRIHIRFF